MCVVAVLQRGRLSQTESVRQAVPIACVAGVALH